MTGLSRPSNMLLRNTVIFKGGGEGESRWEAPGGHKSGPPDS